MSMAVESWRTDNPCTETESYLVHSNWLKHSAKRAEIAEHLSSIKDVVNNPDVAIEKDGAVYKYKRGYGSGKTMGLWLVVIEKPDPHGAHCVRTAYFTRNLTNGSMLCLRNVRLGRG